METIGIFGIGWEAVLGFIGTVATFLGGYSLHSRKKAKAEADKAKAEADSAISAIIDTKNATIKEQGEMIKQLNHVLDEKTARIRELTDKEWQAGRSLSAALERCVKLERSRGDMRVLAEHYKGWHCRNSDCPNRVPPNPQLIGRTYEPPLLETEEAEKMTNANLPMRHEAV